MTYRLYSSIPALLRERAGRARDFKAAAIGRDVVHAAEDTYSPAALHLDDEDLARIRSAAEFFPLEIEMQRMRGGRVEGRPVTLLHLRDVLLLDGDLFHAGARLRVRGGKRHRLYAGALAEVERGSLASSQLGCTFFGHWLLDDLPRHNALRAMAADPFVVAPAASTHQQQYLQTFGLAPRLLGDSLVRRLSVLEEGSMQTFKARELAALSTALRASAAPLPAPDGVMLLRGGSGRKRLLVNEPALADMLAARGFRIVDPMTSSVAEMAASCANAPVVVGIEGSHMTHAVLALGTGAAFITIQPPFKFDNTCKPYCDALAIKYGFTVGTAAEGGFQIEADRLLRMIDKIVAAPLDRASYAR